MACPCTEPIIYYTTATMDQYYDVMILNQRYIVGMGFVRRVSCGLINNRFVSCVEIVSSVPEELTAKIYDPFEKECREYPMYKTVDSLPFKLYRVDDASATPQ